MRPLVATFNSFVVLVAASVASVVCGGELVLRYDASSGLLPTDVCWEHVGARNAPPPVVARGALTLGPTGWDNGSYFFHAFPSIGFADGAALEASIKVDESTWFAQFPYRRTGFYLQLNDSTGAFAGIGIASDRVLLSTADQNWSDQSFLVNTTDAFHTYRLEFEGSTAKVLMDGAVVLTAPVGTGGQPNIAYFGDLSILGASTTRTAYIQVEGVPICSIADIDCSGHVDATDLAILIGAWGTALCEADLNDDGAVDAQDLAMLLGLWG